MIFDVLHRCIMWCLDLIDGPKRKRKRDEDNWMSGKEYLIRDQYAHWLLENVDRLKDMQRESRLTTGARKNLIDQAIHDLEDVKRKLEEADV